MQARTITFPAEHGALVTLGGAALASTLVAPAPAIALAAAAVFTSAYLARGPIERKTKGLTLRSLDAPALIVYALVAAACVVVVWRARPEAAWPIGAIALAIPVAGALTRSAKLRRSVLVETGGMLAVGASAGADLFAGGGTVTASASLAIALATYSAAAIFIVRAQTRPLSRRHRMAFAWIGVAILALGAAGTGLLAGRMAFAFLPRGVHALARTLWIRESKRIKLIALRESLELGLFVVLIAVI